MTLRDQNRFLYPSAQKKAIEYKRDKSKILPNSGRAVRTLCRSERLENDTVYILTPSYKPRLEQSLDIVVTGEFDHHSKVVTVASPVSVIPHQPPHGGMRKNKNKNKTQFKRSKELWECSLPLDLKSPDWKRFLIP